MNTNKMIMNKFLKFTLKSFLIILILLLISVHIYSQDFWTEVIYPDSIEIISQNVSNSDYILIGSNYPTGGIYKNDYSFSNWEYKGPINWTVWDIEINSLGVIYFATTLYVYKSTNGGDDWTECFFFDDNLVSLEIDNNNGLWVGTWGYIFHSSDNGATWDTSLCTHNSEVFNDFAFGPNGEIYAVSQDFTSPYGGFYISYNGYEWQNPSLHGIGAVTIETTTLNTIFVGSRFYGLFRSFDNGNTWETVYENIDAIALTIDSLDNIYVGSDASLSSTKGLFMSEDLGQSWDTMDQTGLTNKHIQRIEISNSGHLFVISEATYGHQLFQSVNPITNVSLYPSTTSSSLLYPNPCSDYIYLSTDYQLHHNMYFKIYSITGRIIHTETPIQSNLQPIITNSLNSGLYIIQIYSENHFETMQFQKLSYR